MLSVKLGLFFLVVVILGFLLMTWLIAGIPTTGLDWFCAFLAHLAAATIIVSAFREYLKIRD